MRSLAACAALFLAAVIGPAGAQQAGADRFVDPVSVWSARLSPSGSYVAYIERLDTGGPPREQIVVLDLNAHRAQGAQVVSEENGYFDWVEWKDDDRLVFQVSLLGHAVRTTPTGGRIPNSGFDYSIVRIVAMNRDGTNLVPMFQGQMRRLYYGYGSMRLLDSLPRDPRHILLNALGVTGVGAWRADIGTGQAEQVAAGNSRTIGFVTDGEGFPVIRMDEGGNGSTLRYYRRANGASDWTLAIEAHAGDADTPDFDIVGAGPGANQIYVLARPDNRDLAALYLYDTSTGAYGSPLQESSAADAAAPWIAGASRELIGMCEDVERLACQARDPRMQRHFRALDAFFEHQAVIDLVNTTTDGGQWLLHVEGPQTPGGYFIYEPGQAHIEGIAQTRPSIQPDSLSPTEVVHYQSRDGVPLWAYVTARAGVSGARPMVVMPHGGPEVRDHYDFDPFTQFLASRGYVVLQPNFRGGAGFGHAFTTAGYGQWGRRMQDDVTDAVRHMIDAGIADPHRICIVGASYGGYAALAGIALTPDLYRCGVAIAGVSDLAESIRAEADDTGAYRYWSLAIGDPGRDGAALAAVSPRRLAAQITAPLLLIHGKDDNIVPIHQSELMARALQAVGRSPRFVRIPDEGHHWNNWSRAHRLTLYQEVEAFLNQNLSGQ